MSFANEENLLRQIEELKQESNLKTHWISLITHDLKEVFGSLIWLITAVENESISRDDFFKMLPEIKEGASRNLQTATDTTEWIKTQYGNFKPRWQQLTVYELFEKLKRENEGKLKAKDLNFRFTGNKNLDICSDSILVNFILKKILDNAIQFSYKSGVIEFVTSKEEETVSIAINDFGKGLSSASVERIFTFDVSKYEGTNGEKGAGLSLKIVKEFVNLIDAKIKIRARQNGTSVHLEFPVNAI